MTNRILLDSGGLKISVPGVDVLSAGQRYLAFSPNYKMPRIYQSGSVSLNINSAYAGQTGAISFGKTFDTPPTVFYYLVRADGFCASGQAWEVYSQSIMPMPLFIANVTRSDVSFTLRSYAKTSSINTVHYIVMES